MSEFYESRVSVWEVWILYNTYDIKRVVKRGVERVIGAKLDIEISDLQNTFSSISFGLFGMSSFWFTQQSRRISCYNRTTTFTDSCQSSSPNAPFLFKFDTSIIYLSYVMYLSLSSLSIYFSFSFSPCCCRCELVADYLIRPIDQDGWSPSLLKFSNQILEEFIRNWYQFLEKKSETDNKYGSKIIGVLEESQFFTSDFDDLLCILNLTLHSSGRW